MQSKNQVVILGISVFEKPEQTVQSNRSADRVRKKRPPSYFAVATWTSNFILYFYNALDVSCPEMELVEVSIFYKSEKTSGQTVWPRKIKKVALFYLIKAA